MVIDAPCLDCGEALRVEVCDGRILRADPPTIQAYVDIPFDQWWGNLPDS